MAALVNEAPLPAYPDDTPYLENKNGTYWPNLNPNAQKAFDQVQAWIAEREINMNDVCLTTIDHRLTVLRYLRANGFDAKKAMAHIEKNIVWRRDMKVTELITQRPEDILGYNLDEMTPSFPHWQYGFDRTGRPVVYKQYAKFDAGKIKKLSGGNYDRVVQYHVWEQEACGRLCLQQSERLGRIVETTTGIVDVLNMSLWQITRDFLALTRAIADVDQGQYPETLGRIYVLNAPSAFPYVYGMIKPWLDPVVTAKIFVLGGPKEYEPVLIDFIGKENLPTSYGGDAPALDPSVHPYALTMKEYEKVPSHLIESTSFTETASSKSDLSQPNVPIDEITEEQMHRLEELVAETSFHQGDNTNHDATGHLVEPAEVPGEKVVS